MFDGQGRPKTRDIYCSTGNDEFNAEKNTHFDGHFRSEIYV
jgi:hypothetical protein